MFNATVTPGQSKAELYCDLLGAARALVEGEPDPIANMANLAALLAMYLPDCNWVGFYRIDEAGDLVLGPFIGQPACVRIKAGSGVCGTALREGRTQLVPDVHAFPGHIACDARSRSELVVPVRCAGRIVAVIDCDSPDLGRFDTEDAAGLEALADAIGAAIAASA